jgi:hypothetical protein
MIVLILTSFCVPSANSGGYSSPLRLLSSRRWLRVRSPLLVDELARASTNRFATTRQARLPVQPSRRRLETSGLINRYQSRFSKNRRSSPERIRSPRATSGSRERRRSATPRRSRSLGQNLGRFYPEPRLSFVRFSFFFLVSLNALLCFRRTAIDAIRATDSTCCSCRGTNSSNPSARIERSRRRSDTRSRFRLVERRNSANSGWRPNARRR